MFDKSSELFPVKEHLTFLAACSVSPLFSGAFEAEQNFAHEHLSAGILLFRRYGRVLSELHTAAAEVLDVGAENISFMKSSAEGLNLIANGFPFRTGDEIISYPGEYPSNHYPWVIQQKRGAVLKLLPEKNSFDFAVGERPVGWTLEDLERTTGPKTRIVALSHVQFTSGFAADLPRLGEFCCQRGIHLVLDAAQSLGAQPLFPRQWNISAIVSSGWKWLLGPIGSGILYTSPEFRSLLDVTMGGPDMMKQGNDYLDHRWNPFEDGTKFEFSTTPFGLATGLTAAIRGTVLRYGIAEIWKEVSRLRRRICQEIDRSKCTVLQFPEEHSSGILSLVPRRKPEDVVQDALKQNIVLTARGGYLRIAPHFYIGDEELERAITVINTLL
jgi:selenocysteine lyase/cysteine desulfurase